MLGQAGTLHLTTLVIMHQAVAGAVLVKRPRLLWPELEAQEEPRPPPQDQVKSAWLLQSQVALVVRLQESALPMERQAPSLTAAAQVAVAVHTLRASLGWQGRTVNGAAVAGVGQPPITEPPEAVQAAMAVTAP